jgi:hypothetical protein
MVNMAKNPDKFCTDCGKVAKHGDTKYCWFCDPAIPAHEKQKARAKGGRQNRKIEHSINSQDVLPIETAGDLKAYLNLLLGESIDGIDDIQTLSKITLPIVDKFGEIFQIELVEQMTQRLQIIEARQTGKLLEAGDYEHSGVTSNSAED